MTERRVLLQPGYVLHQRAYRDTSALVELFTPMHGRLGMVAKGVRSAKSRWRGLLQVFQPLLLSWTMRGDLGTLTGVESQGPALQLAPEFFASGFYLNEILMRLLTRHDAQLELFGHYDAALRGIATLGTNGSVTGHSADNGAKTQLESLLRKFELQMLAELGYGLVLDHDIHTNEPVCVEREYVYLFERGPVVVQADTSDREGLAKISGQTLLALQAGDLSTPTTRMEAKRLLRAVLGRYLGNKPLLSRQLMQPAGRSRQSASLASGETIPNALP